MTAALAPPTTPAPNPACRPATTKSTTENSGNYSGKAAADAYCRCNEASAVLDAAADAMSLDAVWGLVRLLDRAMSQLRDLEADPTLEKYEDASGALAEVLGLLEIVSEWDQDAHLLAAALTVLSAGKRLLDESFSSGVPAL